MERKFSKENKVFDDEDFGACINPLTGTVLNVNRRLAVLRHPFRRATK